MTRPSTEDIAARWSARAEQYHRWGDLEHGHPAYRLAWTDALTGLVGAAPRRIVDVGTGTAEIALLLTEMGHDVTGFDIAPGMLARARSKAADTGLRIQHGDAYALPLPAGSTDVVVNRMVFWTLHDPASALREWRRVLAPGGRIVVIDGLHFGTDHTVTARLRRLRERTFWSVHDRVQRRDPPRHRGSYGADAVAPPGMSWSCPADAARHFVDAGLDGVATGRLDAVARAHRRTAPLRWRMAGLLPEFFTHTWTAP